MSVRVDVPPPIQPGLLNLPGATPKSRVMVEQFLEDDRVQNHCFNNERRFHNHLSHHILTAYDLGSSESVLQDIFRTEWSEQRRINVAGLNRTLKDDLFVVTAQNWKCFLGRPEYYISYLPFFLREVASLGSKDCFEHYVLSDDANCPGVSMLDRILEQFPLPDPNRNMQYGVEFGCNAIVASGLAQTAVSIPVFDRDILHSYQDDHNMPLLAVLKSFYDSSRLTPAMLDPNELLFEEKRDILTAILRDRHGAAEVLHLASFWAIDEQNPERNIEELFWASTLLVASVSPDEPRLEFFLLHVLNSAIFLPSVIKLISSSSHRRRFLQSLLSIILFYIVMRGMPRIDPKLVMSYSDAPGPPALQAVQSGDDAIAPYVPGGWRAIVDSALYTPDAHTIKAIRSLYYAAQKYGTVPPGSVPGAFLPGPDGNGFVETLEGIADVDGTIFIRAAGWIMNSVGWVSHGQTAKKWDNSASPWWWSTKNANA